MGYAGYAPGHKTDMRTPLQEYLKMVKVDKSLETMEKLTRNSAQSPGDEKFRKVRLTNEKIAAVLTDVPGAVEAMKEMGWVETEGEDRFLVLPKDKSVTMREVREIDTARATLKKEEEEAMKKRIAARNKIASNPEKAALQAQIAADKEERKARGPVTEGSKAMPKGDGKKMTAEVGTDG